jgi:radical SAM superfamily enzyme YgiQ (UPF0313 family)
MQHRSIALLYGLYRSNRKHDTHSSRFQLIEKCLLELGTVSPGDIVGIGINSGNCTAGYRVLMDAKRKGATVIVGGVHPTILPNEPLDMGADAVVTGNGDAVWGAVIADALSGQLQKRYNGGRQSGEHLLAARWDLLNRRDYLIPTIQTVAGCPENCGFCSVWVTDGRQPRQRTAARIVNEVNQLYEMGYRLVMFADDNFNPATLGRIAREPSPHKRENWSKSATSG